MNYVTIIHLVTTAVYLFYIGVIPSISDSYRTKERKLFYHLFFTVSTALIMLQGLYVDYYVWYLLAGFFFYSISVASRFWLTLEGPVHVVTTYTAIGLGIALTMVRIWPYWGWWALTLVVILGAGALLIQMFVRRNRVYWQEIAAYIIVFGPITTI